MISLNLLSPAEQSSVNKTKIYFLLRGISFRIISFTAIALTQSGKITSIEAAINELNNQLSRAQIIQAEYVSWTNFLIVLDEYITDSIELNRIQVNTNTLTFKITGLAASRNSLIIFQEQITKLPFLSNLSSPISNLAQKENINFEMTGQLNETIYD